MLSGVWSVSVNPRLAAWSNDGHSASTYFVSSGGTWTAQLRS